MSTTIVDEIPEDEEPSGLRARLAEASKQLREREAKLSQYEVRDLLTEKGLDLVKPEDLTSVPTAEREAKATEIQASRRQLQEELLRKALQGQGLEGEELEDLVAQAVGQKAAESETADAVSRMRQAGSAPGTPVPAVNTEKLHGYDALVHAFEADEAKNRRR